MIPRFIEDSGRFMNVKNVLFDHDFLRHESDQEVLFPYKKQAEKLFLLITLLTAKLEI